ncbi:MULTISPECIES: hypothetical protein [unclassified Rhizobium]|uniref:hypothetical protein n=1 Tax=unclassified Rhizobium TaxID=2613769 RepID=UPI000AAC2B6F|nr:MULTISPECIES: hypothetical protein [unclassified Rhizobium]
MPKLDLTDYEKRIAADHERQCRCVQTMHGIWQHCPVRKCRRDRACTGEMLVSAHQDRKVRIQRELGLSGKACAKLPQCIATADAKTFAAYSRRLDNLNRYLIAHPDETLRTYDRYLKGRQPPRDTANP